ncbi:MAG: glutathionylspermidine synthase family protein [Geminicoccaceae bacterium]|nr:glutathionylspermidine synthase family protein [Geminicoccaceae bacterium]
MERVSLPERADWMATAEDHGFGFHSTGPDGCYWVEGAAYRFTLERVERDVEAPAADLLGLCYETVERAVADDDVLRRLDVPEAFWPLVRESWRRGERDLYGRFDFAYDGEGPAKLLEFNADTPTALYEASVFQWLWLEQMRDLGHLPAGADQFNAIHERLIDAFGRMDLGGHWLHFASCRDAPEDRATVDYLRDCAHQAGLATDYCTIEDIGRDAKGRFVDPEGHVIGQIFKLYPWEDLIREEFGALIPASGTRFIEPPWKMVLANKGLLALLWERHEGHPNLLPAYFEDDPRASTLASYARKHLFGREGDGVRLVRDGREVAALESRYGEGRHVVQALADLPRFERGDGTPVHPVVGAWVVAGEPVGMGIREDAALITGDNAHFVPHFLAD